MKVKIEIKRDKFLPEVYIGVKKENPASYDAGTWNLQDFYLILAQDAIPTCDSDDLEQQECELFELGCRNIPKLSLQFLRVNLTGTLHSQPQQTGQRGLLSYLR